MRNSKFASFLILGTFFFVFGSSQSEDVYSWNSKTEKDLDSVLSSLYSTDFLRILPDKDLPFTEKSEIAEKPAITEETEKHDDVDNIDREDSSPRYIMFYPWEAERTYVGREDDMISSSAENVDEKTVFTRDKHQESDDDADEADDPQKAFLLAESGKDFHLTNAELMELYPQLHYFDLHRVADDLEERARVPATPLQEHMTIEHADKERNTKTFKQPNIKRSDLKEGRLSSHSHTHYESLKLPSEPNRISREFVNKELRDTRYLRNSNPDFSKTLVWNERSNDSWMKTNNNANRDRDKGLLKQEIMNTRNLPEAFLRNQGLNGRWKKTSNTFSGKQEEGLTEKEITAEKDLSETDLLALQGISLDRTALPPLDRKEILRYFSHSFDRIHNVGGTTSRTSEGHTPVTVKRSLSEESVNGRNPLLRRSTSPSQDTAALAQRKSENQYQLNASHTPRTDQYQLNASHTPRTDQYQLNASHTPRTERNKKHIPFEEKFRRKSSFSDDDMTESETAVTVPEEPLLEIRGTEQRSKRYNDTIKLRSSGSEEAFVESFRIMGNTQDPTMRDFHTEKEHNFNAGLIKETEEGMKTSENTPFLRRQGHSRLAPAKQNATDEQKQNFQFFVSKTSERLPKSDHVRLKNLKDKNSPTDFKNHSTNFPYVRKAVSAPLTDSQHEDAKLMVESNATFAHEKDPKYFIERNNQLLRTKHGIKSRDLSYVKDDENRNFPGHAHTRRNKSDQFQKGEYSEDRMKNSNVQNLNSAAGENTSEWGHSYVTSTPTPSPYRNDRDNLHDSNRYGSRLPEKHKHNNYSENTGKQLTNSEHAIHKHPGEFMAHNETNRGSPRTSYDPAKDLQKKIARGVPRRKNPFLNMTKEQEIPSALGEEHGNSYLGNPYLAKSTVEDTDSHTKKHKKILSPFVSLKDFNGSSYQDPNFSTRVYGSNQGKTEQLVHNSNQEDERQFKGQEVSDAGLSNAANHRFYPNDKTSSRVTKRLNIPHRPSGVSAVYSDVKNQSVGSGKLTRDLESRGLTDEEAVRSDRPKTSEGVIPKFVYRPERIKPLNPSEGNRNGEVKKNISSEQRHLSREKDYEAPEEQNSDTGHTENDPENDQESHSQEDGEDNAGGSEGTKEDYDTFKRKEEKSFWDFRNKVDNSFSEFFALQNRGSSLLQSPKDNDDRNGYSSTETYEGPNIKGSFHYLDGRDFISPNVAVYERNSEEMHAPSGYENYDRIHPEDYSSKQTYSYGDQGRNERENPESQFPVLKYEEDHPLDDFINKDEHSKQHRNKGPKHEYREQMKNSKRPLSGDKTFHSEKYQSDDPLIGNTDSSNHNLPGQKSEHLQQKKRGNSEMKAKGDLSNNKNNFGGSTKRHPHSSTNGEDLSYLTNYKTIQRSTTPIPGDERFPYLSNYKIINRNNSLILRGEHVPLQTDNHKSGNETHALNDGGGGTVSKYSPEARNFRSHGRNMADFTRKVSQQEHDSEDKLEPHASNTFTSTLSPLMHHSPSDSRDQRNKAFSTKGRDSSSTTESLSDVNEDHYFTSPKSNYDDPGKMEFEMGSTNTSKRTFGKRMGSIIPVTPVYEVKNSTHPETTDAETTSIIPVTLTPQQNSSVRLKIVDNKDELRLSAQLRVKDIFRLTNDSHAEESKMQNETADSQQGSNSEQSDGKTSSPKWTRVQHRQKRSVKVIKKVVRRKPPVKRFDQESLNLFDENLRSMDLLRVKPSNIDMYNHFLTTGRAYDGVSHTTRKPAVVSLGSFTKAPGYGDSGLVHWTWEANFQSSNAYRGVDVENNSATVPYSRNDTLTTKSTLDYSLLHPTSKPVSRFRSAQSQGAPQDVSHLLNNGISRNRKPVRSQNWSDDILTNDLSEKKPPNFEFYLEYPKSGKDLTDTQDLKLTSSGVESMYKTYSETDGKERKRNNGVHLDSWTLQNATKEYAPKNSPLNEGMKHSNTFLEDVKRSEDKYYKYPLKYIVKEKEQEIKISEEPDHKTIEGSWVYDKERAIKIAKQASYPNVIGSKLNMLQHSQVKNQNWVHKSVSVPKKKDYPKYSRIPKTKFSCKKQKHSGYYADPETQCQVFHFCHENGMQNSFLCPNSSVFNQEILVCDWWSNVDCEGSEIYSMAHEIERTSIDLQTISENELDDWNYALQKSNKIIKIPKVDLRELYSRPLGKQNGDFLGYSYTIGQKRDKQKSNKQPFIISNNENPMNPSKFMHSYTSFTKEKFPSTYGPNEDEIKTYSEDVKLWKLKSDALKNLTESDKINDAKIVNGSPKFSSNDAFSFEEHGNFRPVGKSIYENGENKQSQNQNNFNQDGSSENSWKEGTVRGKMNNFHDFEKNPIELQDFPLVGQYRDTKTSNESPILNTEHPHSHGETPPGNIALIKGLHDIPQTHRKNDEEIQTYREDVRLWKLKSDALKDLAGSGMVEDDNVGNKRPKVSPHDTFSLGEHGNFRTTSKAIYQSGEDTSGQNEDNFNQDRSPIFFENSAKEETPVDYGGVKDDGVYERKLTDLQGAALTGDESPSLSGSPIKEFHTKSIIKPMPPVGNPGEIYTKPVVPGISSEPLGFKVTEEERKKIDKIVDTAFRNVPQYSMDQINEYMSDKAINDNSYGITYADEKVDPHISTHNIEELKDFNFDHVKFSNPKKQPDYSHGEEVFENLGIVSHRTEEDERRDENLYKNLQNNVKHHSELKDVGEIVRFKEGVHENFNLASESPNDFTLYSKGANREPPYNTKQMYVNMNDEPPDVTKRVKVPAANHWRTNEGERKEMNEKFSLTNEQGYGSFDSNVRTDPSFNYLLNEGNTGNSGSTALDVTGGKPNCSAAFKGKQKDRYARKLGSIYSGVRSGNQKVTYERKGADEISKEEISSEYDSVPPTENYYKSAIGKSDVDMGARTPQKLPLYRNTDNAGSYSNENEPSFQIKNDAKRIVILTGSSGSTKEDPRGQHSENSHSSQIREGGQKALNELKTPGSIPISASWKNNNDNADVTFKNIRIKDSSGENFKKNDFQSRFANTSPFLSTVHDNGYNRRLNVKTHSTDILKMTDHDIESSKPTTTHKKNSEGSLSLDEERKYHSRFTKNEGADTTKLKSDVEKDKRFPLRKATCLACEMDLGQPENDYDSTVLEKQLPVKNYRVRKYGLRHLKTEKPSEYSKKYTGNHKGYRSPKEYTTKKTFASRSRSFSDGPRPIITYDDKKGNVFDEKKYNYLKNFSENSDTPNTNVRNDITDSYDRSLSKHTGAEDDTLLVSDFDYESKHLKGKVSSKDTKLHFHSKGNKYGIKNRGIYQDRKHKPVNFRRVEERERAKEVAKVSEEEEKERESDSFEFLKSQPQNIGITPELSDAYIGNVAKDRFGHYNEEMRENYGLVKDHQMMSNIGKPQAFGDVSSNKELSDIGRKADGKPQKEGFDIRKSGQRKNALKAQWTPKKTDIHTSNSEGKSKSIQERKEGSEYVEAHPIKEEDNIEFNREVVNPISFTESSVDLRKINAKNESSVGFPRVETGHDIFVEDISRDEDLRVERYPFETVSMKGKGGIIPDYSELERAVEFETMNKFNYKDFEKTG